MAAKQAKTKTALAKALGMSLQNLYKTWLPREGFPAETPGGWDVAACEKFISENDERNAGSPEQQHELLTERIGKMRAQREKADFELELLRGQHVSIDEMNEMTSYLCGLFLSYLEQHERLTSALDRSPALMKKTTQINRRLREQLAKELRDVPTSRTD